MAHEAHHREDVSDFRIARTRNFPDTDFDIPIGKCRRNAPRNCQRAVAGTRDAEDKLTDRIVLQRECAQVLLEAGFGTVKRHEQGDRGQVSNGIRISFSVSFASCEARSAYDRDGCITDRCYRDDIKAHRQDARKLHAMPFASLRKRALILPDKKFPAEMRVNDRSIKPNRAMIAVTYGVRQFYLRFKIRVRQWGHLPADRGATVLITNHQHMDEGETITARTFFLHPWKALVMCNSRRTFETGFIAARLPWSARFTRGLNLSGLWARYSILPVENHLFSRPLISLAEELRAAHGDLPIEAILPTETLAPLGLDGCSLSDLWKLPNFARAQTWIKVAHLKQPFRREVLENLRSVTERDLEAIVDRVRTGATFYVTPEGDFSRDGRMHFMRKGIVEALSPFADLWLCAVAYDPFAHGRLSMLYRVLPCDGAVDIGTSLAAARPITTSALLATFLIDHPETFAVQDAVRAVRERLDSLPGNVFVDPELRNAPKAAVVNALKTLGKRGTLTIDGEGYRLTEQRIDERFPHVADMIAFQRNMLDETLTSAQRI